MIFDTHAHYDDGRFDGDRDELLAALPEAGVRRVVMPGADINGQAAVAAIAARYDFIYCAAGIHPNNPATADGLSVLEDFLKDARKHKIVAVGECGLDYHLAEGYPPPDRAAQRAAFDAQLCLAERYNLPVIVHDREAHEDCLDIVRARRGLRAVFHCFSGDEALARTLTGMGHYISFTGSVTYKKNGGLRQAAAAVPDEMLMVETDAPYLAPEPVRGRRCDSRMIPHILAVLAVARGQTAGGTERLTWENGLRFFGV